MSILNGLEINKIDKLVNNYFQFEDSQIEYEKLGIIYDANIIKKEHEFLKEGLDFFNNGGILYLKKVKSLYHSFSLVNKDGVLNEEELYYIMAFLDNVEEFKKNFDITPNYFHLNDISLDLIEFKDFNRNLHRCILPDLSLSNDASSLLKELTNQIAYLESSYSSILRQCIVKYKEYLSEEKEQLKNGISCLSVKANFKYKVNGLITDTSNSGETCYIIPLEILNLENKIAELKNKKLEEINRILKEFSTYIKKHLDDFNLSYKLCLKLDSILARANFGYSYNGCIASISDDIYLQELGILLINPDKLIRNSLSLGGDKPKIMVISGPNAGGKTVLIKSVALAIYMNQRLLLVPCLGKASLKIFDNIVFISGDNQSILDNLSTFSSHISIINDGLKQLSENSLFIVDEIGQGTSPNDGEAIGVGVIKYLEKIGCFSIITSHYDGIKELALNDNLISNGAMIFNVENIKPTFKFKQDLIGKSYALEVANNIGLLKEVILNAKDFLKSKQNYSQEEVLTRLNKLEDENIKLNDQLKAKIDELDRLTKKRNDAIIALNKQKEDIQLKADKKIEDIVSYQTSLIEKAYKEKKISLQQLAEMKGLMNSLHASKPNKIPLKAEQKHDFKENDKVKVESLNGKGFIISINLNKNIAKVNVDGLIINSKLEDLIYIPPSNLVEKKVSTLDKFIERKVGVPIELNIIGLREEEAKEKLEKYMDDVILARYHQVRIIHGFGSGILRKMVQKYLSNNKNVKSFRNGGENEGGLGATIVYLK